MKALNEKLTDIFLMEADPDNWPGAGQEPNKMSKEDRGNRVWVKKDATATIVLMLRNLAFTGMIERINAGEPGADSPDEDALEAVMAEAERDAKRQIDRVMRKVREA